MNTKRLSNKLSLLKFCKLYQYSNSYDLRLFSAACLNVMRKLHYEISHLLANDDFNTSAGYFKLNMEATKGECTNAFIEEFL